MLHLSWFSGASSEDSFTFGAGADPSKSWGWGLSIRAVGMLGSVDHGLMFRGNGVHCHCVFHLYNKPGVGRLEECALLLVLSVYHFYDGSLGYVYAGT